MVKKIMNIVIVTISVTITIHKTALSQDNTSFSKLNNYSKWGLVVGSAVYDRASISQEYGTYNFQNRPIWSYNFGLEYDFYPDKKWSFVTGLWVNKEPLYNIKFKILKKDLYSHFTDDYEDVATGYAIHTFSIPLLMKYNLRANENTYFNFFSGLKAMYFPPGSSHFGVDITSLELNESREIFGLNMESQDFSYYGSFVIGAGVSFARKKVLLKAKAIYVMNFQNTIKGEYQFGNMFSSPPARGTYEFSGNYLGILLTANLKKSKNPLFVFKSHSKKE